MGLKVSLSIAAWTKVHRFSFDSGIENVSVPFCANVEDPNDIGHSIIDDKVGAIVCEFVGIDVGMEVGYSVVGDSVGVDVGMEVGLAVGV